MITTNYHHAKAYKEGRKAYITHDDCPYAPSTGQNDMRVYWWLGFTDAEIIDKCGEILDICEEEWP